jgi:hypothetical protein
MLAVLKRILVVPLGFVLGTITAAVVLFTLGSERITHAIAGKGDASIQDAIKLVEGTVLLASALTIVPAVLVVIVGEVARIRTVYYYVLGGGAALAAAPLIAQYGDIGSAVLSGTAVWQVFATAGFMGGFVYWMVAGRSA